MADLIYNIVEQSLRGGIDGTWITARAVAGGRAGSKSPGVVEYLRANNPYATHVKKTSSVAGGPLPVSTYTLRTHELRSNWIRLVPVDTAAMRGRTGFAIHGRGRRGSDGCIVPSDFAVVLLLYKLVKAREDAGKPAPTLSVVAIGDTERFDRLNRTV
jgi:hypothetical protein